MSKYAPTPLREKQLIRLREDGPVVEVLRVSHGAAYVRSAETRHVVIKNQDPTSPDFGKVIREFDGTTGTVLAISPNAFVFPV